MDEITDIMDEVITKEEVRNSLNKPAMETILGSLLAVGGASLLIPDVPKEFEFVNYIQGYAGCAGIGVGLAFVYRGTRDFCEVVADIYTRLTKYIQYLESTKQKDK